MHEPADPMLEGLLRATLADRAERIRPSVTAVAVQERLEARRQQRIAPRRRPWLLLGVAALLVVSVAAVLVAQRRDATEAAATTYQAIVASSCSIGTARLTSPHCTASGPDSGLPVSASSLALASPRRCTHMPA